MALDKQNLHEQDQERPCRPFTAYNIFFHLEKERVLQEQGRGYAAKIKAIDPSDRDLDMGAALRPTKYQQLVLPVEWYVPDPGKKCRLATKKNRDPPHGIFTFVELTKMISSEWKVIDEETKTYCTNLADEQLQLYNADMKVFIDKYGAEAAKRLPKSKSKSNKTAAKSKKTFKTTKTAGTKAKRSNGEDRGNSKFVHGILPTAPDRDDQIYKDTSKSKSKSKSNKKNGTKILQLHRRGGVNGGLQGDDYNHSSLNTDDIEPEPLSFENCDYIPPVMSYWANQVVHGKMDFDMIMGSEVDISSHRFYSQNLTPAPQMMMFLDENQAACNRVDADKMLTIESGPGPSRGLEAEQHFDQHKDDIMEDPDQVCNFNIEDFDWNWRPNPLFEASVPRNEINNSVHHDQDHQELALPAFRRQTTDQPCSLTYTSSRATDVQHAQHPYQPAVQSEKLCFTAEQYLCRETNLMASSFGWSLAFECK